MKKKLYAMVLSMYAMMILMSGNTASASSTAANEIEKSKLYTGTMNLASDALAAVCGISFIVGAACIAYFLWRRGMADQAKKEEWNDRIKVGIVCTILIPLVSGLLAVVAGYYK